MTRTAGLRPAGFVGRLGTAFCAFAAGIAVLAALAGPAEAQTRNPFEVSGVRVDATAKSASEARDIAIREGLAKAFRMLVERTVPAGQAARIATPPHAQLEAMVSSFGVDKEKTSSTRYLAELTVAFKRDAVRRLFDNAGASYSVSVSPPVLVVPVWTGPDGVTKLWEGGNPWMQGWLPLTSENQAIVPVVLSTGTLQDQQLIGADPSRASDPQILQMLARNYRLERVALMNARAGQRTPDGSNFVTVDILLLNGADQERFSPTFEVLLTGSDKDLEPVARAIHSMMEERWKSRTQVASSSQGTIRVSVPIASLEQWIDVEQRIRNVPAVTSMVVNALGTGGAAVTLSFKGAVDQLTLAMRESDLILDRAPSGGYRIMSRSAQ